jgi:3-methylcrotonyl-CoA carboxylase alpha subunit
MRHAFRVGDEMAELWLSHDRGRFRLHLGDAPAELVRLDSLGQGAFDLVVGGESHRVHLAFAGDSVFIHLDGEAYEVAYLDPVPLHDRAHGAGGEDVARAPMPGIVVATPVAAGARVELGQTLVIIESMKLETAIKAWRAGVVGMVHVAVGQSFERGADLVSLEAVEG